MARDTLTDVLLEASLLVAKLRLVPGQARNLRVDPRERCLGGAAFLGFLRALRPAPLEARIRLPGLDLGPLRLVGQRCLACVSRGLVSVDGAKAPVDGVQARLRRVHFGKVKAGCSFASGLRIHGKVAVLRDRLAREGHNLARQTERLGICEGQAPAVSHGIRHDDVAQQKLEGTGEALLESHAIQGQAQRAPPADELLEPGVRGSHAEVAEGQECHRGKHSLLQIPHALPGDVTGFNHDGIEELSHGHVHSHVEALLRRATQLDHTPMHARNRVLKVRARLCDLTLVSELALRGGDILDRVQQLPPLFLQLILLVAVLRN
mmetsp:Transcript_81832/g.227948  ORF Transcript_81832/g.227948 Transcript_81832/m.227948 type:complete len:321 (+) Transcript_81832:1460-2422(+)